MKIGILLVVFVVTSLVGFGQNKKEQLEQAQAKVDSLLEEVNFLEKELDSVIIQMDSIKAERNLFYNLYETIKDEIIGYNFEPSKISFLIDSLRDSRDSSYAFLIGSTTMLQDSIVYLMNTNVLLQEQMDSILSIPVDKDDMMKELKQLKELLDNKIIDMDLFVNKRDLIMQKW